MVPLRTAATAAALVLAVLSRGDVVVLAALLGLAAWHLPALGAVVPALLASAWRWGSTSLDALAGAQAVLGPAGWTGPAAAAASAWLAAVALVLAAPRGRGRRVAGEVGVRGLHLRLPDLPGVAAAAATGATAAVVVAGPAPGGAVWVRVLATAVATGLALVVAAWRTPPLGTLVDGFAIVAGLGALALAGLDAPALSGSFDGVAARTGLALGLAVAGVVAVGQRAVVAMRQQRA